MLPSPIELRLRHLRQKTANFQDRRVYHPAVKIAFLSPPVPGHLNPMTALARKLRSRNLEKNNNTFREYRFTRTPSRGRTRTAIPTIESGQTKRDLTVSSFMLALVLVGVVVAAHTDRPVFWLLIGPTPFALLHTTRTFLRRRVIRREGLLMFCKTASMISRNSSNKKFQPDRRNRASAYARVK
jgi:hypothetical protein